MNKAESGLPHHRESEVSIKNGHSTLVMMDFHIMILQLSQQVKKVLSGLEREKALFVMMEKTGNIVRAGAGCQMMTSVILLLIKKATSGLPLKKVLRLSNINQ